MTSLARVVSGGQTGVDQAALRAARACGLEMGGWCPPGRASDSGTIPAEFNLTETPQERSPEAPDVPRSQRTEWNVRDSDATLVLRPAAMDGIDTGTDWTFKCARRYGRPLLVCDPDERNAAQRIRVWLGAWAVRTLNVAGPGEATHPGIGDRAYPLLAEVFPAPSSRK